MLKSLASLAFVIRDRDFSTKYAKSYCINGPVEHTR